MTELVIFKAFRSEIVEKISPGSHVAVAETISNSSLLAYKGASLNNFIVCYEKILDFHIIT